MRRRRRATHRRQRPVHRRQRPVRGGNRQTRTQGGHGTHGHYLDRQAREHIHQQDGSGTGWTGQATPGTDPLDDFYDEEWTTEVGDDVSWEQISQGGTHRHGQIRPKRPRPLPRNSRNRRMRRR